VQVELVHVHSARPASLAGVVPRAAGIHHVGWFVEDIDVEQRRLDALGWPEVLAAQTAGGLRLALHDARAPLGPLAGTYEPSDRLLAFYASVAAAAVGWAGDHPVRPA